MKYTVVFLLLSLSLSIEGYSQMAPHTNSLGGSWSYIKISADSLKPIMLSFPDSVHGILCCARQTMFYQSPDLLNGRDAIRVYWYSTSDGGKTWIKLDMASLGYRDTVCDGEIYYFMKLITGRGNKTMYLGNMGDTINNCDKLRQYKLFTSSDFGQTWIKKNILSERWGETTDISLVGSIGNNALFMYRSVVQQDSLSGELLLSLDYGSTFPYVKSNSTFREFTKPVSDSNQMINDLVFANSDQLHWTVIPTEIGGCGSVWPCGLNTLVTENGGASWSLHTSQISGFESSPVKGQLQFVKGSPCLYMFPTTFFQYEGYPNKHAGTGGNYSYGSYGESSLNTSFLSSSDYGKTWKSEHKYGNRRRAFEAVDVGNVWMTVCRQDNIHVPERRAGTIVRTTDNGVTWEEDSSTLIINDVGAFDGRIITFSDPRHGWIAANDQAQTYIFRWVADEKTSVKPEAGEEFETFRIKIFPNPAQEETKILLPETRSIARVEFF
ncbi:MAG TPA: sialidase family protein, partial [Candidatus Kapabacteria bacterium]